MKRDSDPRDGRPEKSDELPTATLPRPHEKHTVAISSLLPGDSPRHTEEEEHTRLLAETDTILPPILVHRKTMRVIDGMHRLKAAIKKGQKEIDVIFFDGSEEDAFVRAVQENIAHGLPLSLAERKMAALRILTSHPQLSDRSIAACTGLAAKTVGTLRRRSTADEPQLNTRMGTDGRLRPLSAAEGRRRASKVIAERPGASLREIAEISGVSVGTACDVRKRIRRGESPIPHDRDTTGGPSIPSATTLSIDVSSASDPTVDKTGKAGDRAESTDFPSGILPRLARDPALRHTDLGRQLLRLLHMQSITFTDLSVLIDAVPLHCTDAVATIARQYGERWHRFARELEHRSDISV